MINNLKIDPEFKQNSDMPAIYNQTAGIDVTGALLSPYGIMIDSLKNEKQAWIEILKRGQSILKSQDIIQPNKNTNKIR
jgi:hypothetical protein